MTVFEYDAVLPDPTAADIRRRKQGTVTGRAPDGTTACHLSFGLTAGHVEIGQVDTFDPYQRQGCAEGLLDYLIAHYGEIPHDGPQENTDVGKAWVATMVERGKLLQ